MATEARPVPAKVLVPAAVGAAVAIALGTYGEVHDPTGESTVELFFSATLNFKVWFATFAIVLALRRRGIDILDQEDSESGFEA